MGTGARVAAGEPLVALARVLISARSLPSLQRPLPQTGLAGCRMRRGRPGAGRAEEARAEAAAAAGAGHAAAGEAAAENRVLIATLRAMQEDCRLCKARARGRAARSQPLRGAPGEAAMSGVLGRRAGRREMLPDVLRPVER